jgi:hypothetical protein
MSGVGAAADAFVRARSVNPTPRPAAADIGAIKLKRQDGIVPGELRADGHWVS